MASGGHAVPLVPLACPPMQGGCPIRLRPPSSARAERRRRGGDSDTTGARHRAVRRTDSPRSSASSISAPSSRPVTASHRGPHNSVENGGVQQEAAHAFRLALKNLFEQVIQHEPVAAGESLDEAGGVGSSPHGERRHVQAGDPALGAVFQGGDVILGEVEAHRLVEERGGFGGGEAQVGGAQLGHLVRARHLARGRFGSSRVAMTRCIRGGACSMRKARASSTDSGACRVVVVEHEDEIIRHRR